jgi:hypothetical protein
MSKLLEQESLLKIYRGSRLLGTTRPVIVVTADTMDVSEPLGEFYIFHDYEGMPFLYRRTTYSSEDAARPFYFGDFADVFSASALLVCEFRAARDRLEFEVSRRDRGFQGELFWSSPPMEYEEVGELPLAEFRAFRRFAEERATMFDFSRSEAIRKLKITLLGFPEFTLRYEPNA